MTPLRIALLTYSTKPRGSVVHTLELATALHHRGHDVCVYALDKDGSGFEASLPFACRLVPARSAPSDMDALIHQRIQEFVAYFETTAPTHDIYHAQDCLSANALAQLRQQRHIPHFIRTVHHIEDYVSPYLQACQDRSIREADRCLCISQHWQAELQHHYQIQAPRVFNGVNLERFSATAQATDAQLKQQLGLTTAPIYLTVGGIEPRKNSITLLRAFAQVRGEVPTAQLVIAGGATLFDYQSYRAEFFSLAEALGLEVERSLILPGVVAEADLPTLYRLADAFVFPSLKEGWGLVVLEAIASGLPVITSNQPPFTEFLTDQQALLVDPTSAEAIAQAMREVLHPDLAQRLRQQSQPLLKDYTWERSAHHHLKVYRDLMAHPSPTFRATECLQVTPER